MSELAKKLYAQVRADNPHLPDVEVGINRTYAGHWQRSKGAWLWYFYNSDYPSISNIGSQWPATECMKAKELEYYYNEVAGDLHISPSTEELRK
ncbi:hypothetical protein LCGC14_2247130 [marine sediment metagenome]|uniref:Uncharacterized protein n=1 Tax=marine sediment metagenome TaxID=412755 RepID=A0A0F9FYT0_9ZZZZ